MEKRKGETGKREHRREKQDQKGKKSYIGLLFLLPPPLQIIHVGEGGKIRRKRTLLQKAIGERKEEGVTHKHTHTQEDG